MDEQGKTYNTRDLLRAEVVELASGSVLGSVVEAILSTRKAIVEYLGILPVEWFRPGLLLRTEDIVGFDESVILVPSAEHLITYNEKQIKKDFLSCSELKRLTLIDQKGQVYGNPVGAVFNHFGRIIALEAEKDLVVQMIMLQDVIAVGSRYLVVHVSAEENLRAAPEAKVSGKDSRAPRMVEGVPEERLVTAKEDDAGNGGDGQASVLYRERQIRYMLGKPSPLSLNGRSGSPIVTAGETISSSIINRLIEEGLLNQIFIALTVERGQIPEERN